MQMHITQSTYQLRFVGNRPGFSLENRTLTNNDPNPQSNYTVGGGGGLIGVLLQNTSTLPGAGIWMKISQMECMPGSSFRCLAAAENMV